MAVHITYFVHGTTTDNEQGIATGWNPGKLSPLGLQQAEELKAIVTDMSFDAVFSSDLKRAVDFAAIVFPEHAVFSDERLREANYGDFNGKRSDQFKTDPTKYIHTSFPLGESYKDVEVRLKNFLESIKNNYDGKTVAIVAHQAPQLALEVLLNGKSWKQAIAEDWRNTDQFQPGWDYVLS